MTLAGTALTWHAARALPLCTGDRQHVARLRDLLSGAECIMNPTRSSLAAFAGLLLVAACSDGTGPATGPNLALSFSTRLPAGALAPSRAPVFGAAVTGADTLTDGTNTLIITKAEIVLREIEREPAGVT